MKRLILAMLLFAAASATSSTAWAKRGLSPSPQVGLSYDGRFLVVGGLRLAYAGQWNAGIFATKEEYSVGIGRKLNDVLPVKNLEVKVFAEDLFGDFKLGVGLMVDL